MASQDTTAITALRYKAVNVSNLATQPSLQRFPTYNPLEHLLDLGGFLTLPIEDDLDDPSRPPDIAPWRSNLVGLSQRNNLYFVAYDEKIHVTMPRGLKQIIPGTPDLILNLPTSSDSRCVGGFIDPGNPHCVNNMLVGNLGSQEILLLACDDGDIIAFNVDKIVTAMRLGASGDTVKAFFHENIGASAWGLAIHGPSRLIAASCNLRQITVFNPAYTSDEEVPEVIDGDELPYNLYSEVERLSQSSSDRKISEKKTFRLGKEGHNVPSLSFADDDKGKARFILATDISGNLWIFAVYTEKSQRVPSIYKNHIQGDRTMGWGVLVLPLKNFKHTEGLPQALGAHNLKHSLSLIAGEDNRPVKVFQVEARSRALRGYPTSRPPSSTFSGSSTSPLVLENDPEEYSDGDPMAQMDEGTRTRLEVMLGNSDHDEDALPALIAPEFIPHHLLMVHTNHGPPRLFSVTPPFNLESAITAAENLVNMHPDDLIGMKREVQLHAFLNEQTPDKPLRFSRKSQTNPDAIPFLDEDTAILRTYQFDVELLAPTPAVPRTVCRNVFKNGSWIHDPDLLRGFERLNLLASIPQLSLVVVASQAGRVALLTLTRPDDSFSINGPVPSFRVDHLLPHMEHLQNGTWPHRALMGMAVSPMPTDGPKIEPANRWRLFMHYYDHTILTYELSRDENTEALLVL